MKIDSVIYRQLFIAKWTNENSLKETELTSSANTGSDCKDIIDIQGYEVVPSIPIQPIDEDSVQELKLLHRGFTCNDRLIHNKVAEIYKKYANISFAINGKRIDICI